MPAGLNPVSASVSAFMPPHSRRLPIASGSSRRSRPMVRHQPQLRLDCSPPIAPFSLSATEMPRRARNSAAHTPMMPPPIMTTSTRCGSRESNSTR